MLWKDLGEAKDRILKFLRLADLVKLSDEELRFLTDKEDLIEGAKEIYEHYPVKYLLVTRGEKGALCMGRKGYVSAEAYDTGCVDTTGAGDAAWGAFLYSFISHKGIEKIKTDEDMSLEELKEMVTFSCAAGSLATAKKGGIPAMPSIDEIKDCMTNGKKLI